MVRNLQQIFNNNPALTNERCEQLLRDNNWDESSALDAAFALTMSESIDPAASRVIAQTALQQGYISPAIHYLAQEPAPQLSELERIQQQTRIQQLQPGQDPLGFLRGHHQPEPAPARPHPHDAEAARVREQERIEREAAERARQAAQQAAQQAAEREAAERRIRDLEVRLAQISQRETQQVQQLQAEIVEQMTRLREKEEQQRQLQDELQQQRLEQQRRELELQQLQQRRELEQQRLHPEPLVTVYWREPDSEEQRSALFVCIAKIKGLFLLHEIAEDLIDVVDYTRSDDVAEMIRRDSINKAVFPAPMVYVRKYPIGDLADVTSFLEKGELPRLLAESSERSEYAHVSFGGVVGSTASGVFSVLTAPYQIWKWATAPPAPEVEADAIDFNVVQCNWYGREQYRVLRFCGATLKRLLPASNPDARATDVRGEYPYQAIDRIYCQDRNTIVIVFNESAGGRKEWIRASQADIIRMKVLFNERSRGRIEILGDMYAK